MKTSGSLALIIFLLSSAAFAALDLSEIAVGARPLGMGKAYIGLADDASAIFVNPAGLSQNKNLNVVSMGGAMLGEVNYVLLGAADSSPLGKFGIGYVNASVAGIPLTRLVGSGRSLEAQQYSATDYNSSLILFSYGAKLSRFLKGGAGGNFSLGGTLKILSQGFSGGGSSLEGANGAGLDADLGFIWEFNRWLTFGLTFQNFLPQTFGGKFVWQRNSVTEGIPMTTHAGGYFRPDPKIFWLLDYETTTASNRPALLHAGIEYWPIPQFALRTGIDQKPRATELGVGVDNNFTAGVGMVLAGFTFDYAFHQFGNLSENATHFFSLGFRGVEKAAERLRGKTEKKPPTIPPAEVVSKPKLKTSPDVPPDYWAGSAINYLVTLGIMDNFPDGNFKPTREITRGELAVILVKAKGFLADKAVKLKFSDVPLYSTESPSISLAVERKYLQGFPDGAFHPERQVTRAEMAAIMAKFSGLHVKPKIKEKVFPDLPVEHWSSGAVAATKESGLFEYLSSKGFGPGLNLTRAEVAEIISKTPTVKKQIEKLISGEE
jgi:hypothetical protein